MAVHGTHQILANLDRVPPALERELQAELDVSAQFLVRSMRARVRKFRSLLLAGIHARATEPFVRDVGPTANYAGPQEEGIKPGGRGLPRFNDPAAADVIAWLRTKAFAGRSSPRRNAMSAVRANLELRDRYEGLAWHIRHKGMKAAPYVLPAFQELERPLRKRLELAAERGLAAGSNPA